jgi:hypothetical protein
MALCRMIAYQVQGLEFKPQYHKKKKIRESLILSISLSIKGKTKKIAKLKPSKTIDSIEFRF